MNNEKIILTDCDGVMLDWEGAFSQWMIQKGYTKQVDAIYDISTAYGIEKADGKRLVKEFNESAWMGFLPAFRDARSGVAKLVEAGYQFVVITSLSLDEKARLLRISNLKNVFGMNVCKEVICLDTGADKDAALAEYTAKYPDAKFWLEDKTENAECGLQFGLTSVLIKHGHNEDCDNPAIKKLDDWNAIADYIIG
jgi:FMN phosphatase YigB (HAD superfamily)